MQRYIIVDTNPEDRSMTLRGIGGRTHVARSTSVLPGVGDLLEGLPPVLGLALLVQDSGQVLRVTFDLVDVSQDVAMDRLHAALTP